MKSGIDARSVCAGSYVKHSVFSLAADGQIHIKPREKFPGGAGGGRQFYHAISPRALGHDLTTGLQSHRGRRQILKFICFKEPSP